MRVGTDLCAVKRWKKLIELYSMKLGKIFTAEEIAHCESKGVGRASSYAGLWATREATAKCLGTGFLGARWQDVHVTWTEEGAPILHLEGVFARRAEALGVSSAIVSISHEKEMAMAVVIMIEGEPC